VLHPPYQLSASQQTSLWLTRIIKQDGSSKMNGWYGPICILNRNLILSSGHGMQAWDHMECTSVRTLEKQTAQPLQFVHSQYTDNFKQAGFQQECLPNIYINKHIHMHMHVCAHENDLTDNSHHTSLMTWAMAGSMVSAATPICHEFGTAHLGSVYCS